MQDPASGMWMQGRDGSGGLGSGDMAGSRVLLGSGEFIGNQSGFIGGGAMLGSGGAMLGSGDMVGSRVLVGSMPDMAGGGQLQMGSREMMREDPGAHPPLATQGESEQHPPGSHFFSWKAGGTRPTVCQVPGCGVDLSGMKEYYMVGDLLMQLIPTLSPLLCLFHLLVVEVVIKPWLDVSRERRKWSGGGKDCARCYSVPCFSSFPSSFSSSGNLVPSPPHTYIQPRVHALAHVHM